MALKGTLKDFGIADILQLIGQQQKTGILHLKSKEQDVRISFKDGNIIAAESATRKKRDLIGTMLVRAEVITELQLNTALENQRRTLKRLGDILVSSGAITHARFKEMMQLQATETLYKLFGWKNGTYAFEQGDVEPEADAITPLRAESVLMEGFRMVDEWPVIKKRIARYDLTFEKLKELPEAPPESKQPEKDPFGDAAFEDAFSEEKRTEKKGDFASIGAAERKVYSYVAQGRTVRKVIDLSCMGEFETCKALCNLLNLEYLRAVQPRGVNSAAMMDSAGSAWDSLKGAMGGVVVTMVVLGAVLLMAIRADWDSFSLTGASKGAVSDASTQKLIARTQISRIEAALDVYRLEKGDLPQGLDALVVAGLLSSDDLRYPWHDRYYYRRLAPQEFILLPPLR